MLGHCAEALLGTHDFEAFTPTRTERSGYERTVIRAEWKRGQVQGDRGRAQAQLLEFWIEADSFLHNMVRAIVGTMMEVGSGRRPLDHFTSLLKGGQRPEAGETAHPQGLYLASVAYGGPRRRRSPRVRMEPDGRLLESNDDASPAHQRRRDQRRRAFRPCAGRWSRSRASS